MKRLIFVMVSLAAALAAVQPAHALTYCLQSGIDRAVNLSHAQVRLTGLGFQNVDLSALPDGVPSCREVTESEHRASKGALSLDVEYRRAPLGGRVGAVQCKTEVPASQRAIISVFHDTDAVSMVVIDQQRGPLPLGSGATMLRCVR